jgi:hypothetical protein
MAAVLALVGGASCSGFNKLQSIALWRIVQSLALKSSGPKGRAGSSPALGI